MTREKVEGARGGREAKAGVWIFGHHYWGLTILQLNATIGWMPVHMSPDYTLALPGEIKAIDPPPSAADARHLRRS